MPGTIAAESCLFIGLFAFHNMALGLRLLFYPKTREYEVVSPDGSKLRLTEEDFCAIKNKMNGIALAFADQARERKRASMLPAISSSFCGLPSLLEDPKA